MILKEKNKQKKAKKLPRNGLFLLLLFTAILGILGVDYAFQEPAIKIETIPIKQAKDTVFSQSDAAFQPDVLRIKIEEKTKQQLSNQKWKAFEEGILIVTDEHWVKGEIHSQKKEQNIPIKLRLKGDWLDHLRGNKWSFRIKVKSPNSWNRLVTFSVQSPTTRSYLNEWLFHQFLAAEDILTPRYDFVQLYLNEESLGIYAYEEHFDKQLAEYKQRREGPIIKLTEDLVWLAYARERKELGEGKFLSGRDHAAYNDAEIRPFKETRTQENPILARQFQAAQSLLYQLKYKQKSASEIVDVDRFARYFAIADVLSAYHGIGWHNVRFYYNPISSKLEPIGYDGYGEGPTSYHGGPFIGYKMDFDKDPQDYFKHLFQDPVFFKRYIAYLNHYSQNDFIENFFKRIKSQIADRQRFIQREFKDYQFDISKIISRTKELQALIKPYDKHSLKVRTQRKKNGKFQLMLANHHHLPIEIIGFGTVENKIRDRLAKPLFLFSTPLYKAPKFTPLAANYDVKYVFYSIAGLSKMYHAPVIDWKLPAEIIDAQKLFANIKLESNEYFQVEQGNILFKKGTHIANKDLIVPAGYKVFFEAGCELDLTNKAAFISNSPVQMLGTADHPIRIYSSDQSANGFTVLEASEKSVLNYVQFRHLNTLQKDNWQLTGAVNFYESEVAFTHCSFIQNHCEDALNLIRSKFELKDSKIAHTFADGLDTDFCEGVLDNVSIQDTGNDATDFSGSVIKIVKMDIHRAGDKGISAGEEAAVWVQSVYINGANIGLASKDLSVLNVDLVTLHNCKQGFVAYKKKPEFGPATITVHNYGEKNVSRLYILDTGSKLILKEQELIGE